MDLIFSIIQFIKSNMEFIAIGVLIIGIIIWNIGDEKKPIKISDIDSINLKD